MLDTRDAIRDVMGRANLPADNLSNLLEMPVLFYALVAVLLATGLADPRFTQLAWGPFRMAVLGGVLTRSLMRTTDSAQHPINPD